jgi:hypothetical protein
MMVLVGGSAMAGLFTPALLALVPIPQGAGTALRAMSARRRRARPDDALVRRFRDLDGAGQCRHVGGGRCDPAGDPVHRRSLPWRPRGWPRRSGKPDHLLSKRWPGPCWW